MKPETIRQYLHNDKKCHIELMMALKNQLTIARMKRMGGLYPFTLIIACVVLAGCNEPKQTPPKSCTYICSNPIHITTLHTVKK